MERAGRPAGAPAPAQALSALAEFIAVPDRAFDGAALAGLAAAGRRRSTAISAALVKAGASVRSAALVGSHATRYTVAADKALTIDGPDAMTANRPQPRPGVLDIAAYVPGKSSAPGVAKVFKLSSNETPLGAEPEGDRGLSGRSPSIWRIIPTARRRRCARRSARVFGLDPERIVCGAGSDDLLNLLARAYLADGDEAIYTTHGFLVYPIATLGAGAHAGGRAGEELHRRRRRDPRAR